MDRRAFLIRIGGGLVAASAPFSVLLPAGALSGPQSPESSALAADTWRTLAAVQEHLLPSEPGAPGAREINAAGYLRSVLEDGKLDPGERALLVRGAEGVERFARQAEGKSFVELSTAQRETVLRAFEQTVEGERWLTEMLGYLIEALLGDPVYGGNPGGIGWRWLAHNPGFPRPPASKRHFLL